MQHIAGTKQSNVLMIVFFTDPMIRSHRISNLCRPQFLYFSFIRFFGFTKFVGLFYTVLWVNTNFNLSFIGFYGSHEISICLLSVFLSFPKFKFFFYPDKSDLHICWSPFNRISHVYKNYWGVEFVLSSLPSFDGMFIAGNRRLAYVFPNLELAA